MCGLRAVRARHFEVDPRMRVDEVDLRHDPRQLDVLVHREIAEAMVRFDRRRPKDCRCEQARHGTES